jgi:DNA invertase Pin-like site-specific DNA recombinase
MQKILIPYIRFSSEEQGKGASYQRQIDRVEKYASENGFTLRDEDFYKDLGKSAFSGKHVSHGALGKFLTAIESKAIPTNGSIFLCIEQIDRLSRQDIDTASTIFKSILRNNVNIITLMDNKIYTKQSLNNFMDIMYSLFLMEQAHIESLKKSERILNVFDQRRKKINQGQNIQFTGMLPSWIDNSGEKYNTNFVLNDKAKIVQDIFKKYIEGLSCSEIALYLDRNNTDQIARKRYKNFTNRWSSARVAHIIANRCVLGEMRIKRTDTICKNYYPAIVSLEDFEEVENIRKRKKTQKTSGRRSMNIFTGKVFCGECGHKYYFETDDKIVAGKKKLYHSLKCSSRRSKMCDSPTINYENFLNSDPAFFDLKKSYDNEFRKESFKIIKTEITNLKNCKKELQEKLSDLEESFINGDYDTELFLKVGTNLKNSIRDLDQNIGDKKYFVKTQTDIYKMNGFDKNKPEDILKARNIINDVYAAFIVIPKAGMCIKLYTNGFVNEFTINKFEKDIDINNSNKKLKSFLLNLKNLHTENKLDGKFSGIIESLQFFNRLNDFTDRVLIEEYSTSDPLNQVYDKSSFVGAANVMDELYKYERLSPEMRKKYDIFNKKET